MSFERPQKGLLVFCCDACDESIEVTQDLDDFKKCWSHARDEGWVLKSNEHYCPGCAELL